MVVEIQPPDKSKPEDVAIIIALISLIPIAGLIGYFLLSNK